MAVFGGKKNESGVDETDFVRIPPGTRIGPGSDGRMVLAFAGDMSLGESLPEFGELSSGRNLSIDAGVTIRADSVKVKATLELEASSRLIARSVEVDRLVSRRGQLEIRTLTLSQAELIESRVVADRITAREHVFIDRGEMEVGTIAAQSLTLTKGSNANILIAEVAKLEGSIPKGGYESFGEFLSKVALYHPEILNDQFGAEARRLAPQAQERPNAAGKPAEADPEAALHERLSVETARLRALWKDREMPAEMVDLLAMLDGRRMAEVRRSLTPTYQKLQPQGKMPEEATEVFREIQRLVREASRGRAEATAGAAGN